MLNPTIELKLKKQQFISIRELIQRIQSAHPDMTNEQIANWILIKLDESQDTPDLLIQNAKGLTRKPIYSDPNFDTYDLLSRVMTHPDMNAPLYEDWSPSKAKNNKFESDDVPF